MRVSPLLHPLAVLRTTIGLTQKQMGDFVNRAARTIQSIELRKMPLTDELALRIAEATGVDEAWLAEGNPNIPPRKGLTLIQAGKGEGEYTKADYEYYRAYVETPMVTTEMLDAAVKEAEARGSDEVDLPIQGFQKVAVRKQQKEIIALIEQDLISQLRLILNLTETTNDMRLVRWKIRRYLEDLAKEFSLDIPQTGISIKALALANPKTTPTEKVAEPADKQAPEKNPEIN
jgi:transcriptional regulator with XRE-family HTH domain